MAYNLIDESWLPVRRASDVREWIPPWQVTGSWGTNPVIALDFPRPDFNGAAAQFLIGLVQTAMTPEDGQAWDEAVMSPPPPERLRETFNSERDAFELFGDGPAFMQDLEMADAGYRAGNKAVPFPVSALLMDAASENALKLNTDHFNKFGMIRGLCPACAAIALHTLQANAPSGGVGHRTSLRGGGPLTTLVLGRTLWETVMCNVLTRGRLVDLHCDSAKPRAGGIYPWLAATVTSERKGARTLSQEVHPFHVFWAMPRRIRLNSQEGPESVCDICGRDSQVMVRDYWAKNYGYNYEANWNHPLTPYQENANGERIPLKGQPSGVRYRNWAGIVEEKDGREPALAVRAYKEIIIDSEIEELAEDTFRIWASGYDMDNMKARAWVESVVPVYMVRPEHRESHVYWVGKLIDLAGEVAFALRQQVKHALFPEGVEVKAGAALFAEIDARFWSETEPGFYEAIKGLRADLGLEGQALDQAMQRRGLTWLHALQHSVRRIFEHYALTGEFRAEDQERLYAVESSLKFFTSEYNPKIRTILDLPKLPKSDKTKKAGRKAKGA